MRNTTEHKTQQDRVLARLKESGYITRNQCLRNYITRLGAIVHSLKKEGYNITGEYKYYERGKDYVYCLK